jgi:hypothetical protein
MNEFSTYEFVVSQKIEGAWRAARIGMITLYVFFVLGCFLAGIRFNILPPLALVPVFTWMLVFFTWRYVSVEYEYSITSGELTFSKIYGNRSRRTVLKLMLRDAIRIAPLDNEEEAKKANVYLPEREFSAISSQSAPDIYFILFEYASAAGKEKRRAIFYFEATQKALQICRFYNPSGTLVTKVSR